ncbi:hypothetical protein C8Q80DRAFT_1265262 [Daedaleopsis nitida]|nr:hypothetical protein C8Q80DRAFT_1265262 [Daedaleopsis nitida]
MKLAAFAAILALASSVFAKSYVPEDPILLFVIGDWRAGNLTLQNNVDPCVCRSPALSPRIVDVRRACTKSAFFVEVAELTGATIACTRTSD